MGCLDQKSPCVWFLGQIVCCNIERKTMLIFFLSQFNYEFQIKEFSPSKPLLYSTQLPILRRNHIDFGNERPPSIASILPSYNVSIGNDPMMSFKTSVIFGSISMTFLILWMIYTQGLAEDYFYRSIYYNLLISFYLLFSITPPLYFFKRIAKFKRALSIVHDIFS